MSFQENLNKILSKHQELSNKLASGIKGEEFIKCSKEYSDLEEVVHQINDYNKALKDCKKIIELCPDHPKVYSYLGLIYHGKRDLIKAIQSYYIAIDLFREEGLDAVHSIKPLLTGKEIKDLLNIKP